MSGVWVKRTPAAKRFREQAGYANYRLNTIVIGLEAVKSGVAKKPADLAVHWASKDVETAADLARSFATNAIMVYVVDALDSYMSDLARAEIWIADPSTASLLRGEFQTDRSDVTPMTPQSAQRFADQISSLVSSPDTMEERLREFTSKHFGRRKRPSLRARFASLVEHALSVPMHYNFAVQFLISWRNRHTHGRSTDRVSAEVFSGLRDAYLLFDQDHAHLDVGRMIENYDSGGSPTLKEVSSLISVSHRVVATIDDTILRRTDADQAFMAALRAAFACETSPEMRIKEYWGRSILAREAKLTAMASRFGFRQARDADPKDKPLYLSQERLSNIVGLDRDSFAERVGVEIKPK